MFFRIVDLYPLRLQLPHHPPAHLSPPLSNSTFQKALLNVPNLIIVDTPALMAKSPYTRGALTYLWPDQGVTLCGTELALDAQIPTVNAQFFRLCRLFLEATGHRMIVEAVKARLVLITCISDLVRAGTPLVLLDHRLPAHPQYQALSQ